MDNFICVALLFANLQDEIGGHVISLIYATFYMKYYRVLFIYLLKNIYSILLLICTNHIFNYIPNCKILFYHFLN